MEVIYKSTKYIHMSYLSSLNNVYVCMEIIKYNKLIELLPILHSSVIFIQFYARGSIEWRYSFYHNCGHSKILQNVAKYRSIQILFRIAKRSIFDLHMQLFELANHLKQLSLRNENSFN